MINILKETKKISEEKNSLSGFLGSYHFSAYNS